jgi:hypothetical protein
LKTINPYTVIDYIKCSIDIKINEGVEKCISERDKHNNNIIKDSVNSINEYEKIIRKYESELRTLIGV